MDALILPAISSRRKTFGDTLLLRTFLLLNHVSRQSPTVMNQLNSASRTVSVSIVTVLFKPNDT
jgi:hypothetical protein